MLSKSKQSKKEKITLGKVVLKIENLAQTTTKGFKEVDERFKKVDEKIENLAQTTTKGFKEVDERFKEVDGRFKEVDGRFNGLENEFNGLRGEFYRLEQKVDAKMTEGVDKMLTIADGIAKQFSDWKQESIIQVGIEARQNDKLDNHEIRIGKLEEARKI